DLVDTQSGETYMVHLCGRPIRNRGRCILGRETAIQKMVWDDDGWLRTADRQGIPHVTVPAPALLVQEFPKSRVREDFNDKSLPTDFQWLRSPWPDELFSLTARRGYLRVFGRESIGSPFRQGLVARRQQSHCFSASTSIDFDPQDFQQLAGLVCYYNSVKFHYFYITHDETLGRHLRVMSFLPDQVMTDSFTPPIPISRRVPIHLRVEVDFERLKFGYSFDGETWNWLPEQFDASILSDEASMPGLPNFTGAFVGVCCQDSSGAARPADFDYFEYQERDYQPDPGWQE
ncbi:MAG TPA: family 43 glycosylhydrolase, partial [Pyrinomonadaceae bacterium]